jgi:hypothetical protein
VRRFLLCASTLLGVSPVSSLLRLDVLLSSSLLCVLRSTGACQEGSSSNGVTPSKGTHFAPDSRSWHLRLSVEFLPQRTACPSQAMQGVASPCGPADAHQWFLMELSVLAGLEAEGGVVVRPWAAREATGAGSTHLPTNERAMMAHLLPCSLCA